MNSQDASRTSARYEQSRLSPTTRKSILVVLVLIVLAVGGGVTYAQYKIFGSTDLESNVTRYEATSDTVIEGDISLNRDTPEEAAVCVIRARNRDGDEVARREVYFPPRDSSPTVVFTGMNTTMLNGLPPGIIDVYGCSYTVPEYLSTN
ncbi:DUF4307 domain-containing protein [Tomitella biformata]|uniref:DUF4307 domain-containing protein n=1 Tax=Tomitella biformata TaxID=630403 RepID=UPI000464AC37|nr:DUF4307 domain-containing protein [Tomitella biformata]